MSNISGHLPADRFHDRNALVLGLEPKAGLEPATTRLWSDNPILRPVEKARRTRDELGTQPYWRLGRDLNPLAVSRLADNPSSTARLKNSMDKCCRRYGASQAGLEPATPDSRPAALSR